MKCDHHEASGALKIVLDDETKKVHKKTVTKHYFDWNLDDKEVEMKPKEVVEVHDASCDL